jgi:acyl-CoA thioester hydrolase
VKPPAIPLEKITALHPWYRLIVPPEFEDENGHMNIRWYLAVFDDAGYPFVASLGITPEYHQQHGTGGYDLEHHIHYLREVMIGDTITVYVRLLGHTPKRIHYMMFMVNETRGTLASIFECINSFANLTERRTAPYPDAISANIKTMLAEHQKLDWDAPISGVMKA